jgi:excisionase family DNA binding protein
MKLKSSDNNSQNRSIGAGSNEPIRNTANYEPLLDSEEAAELLRIHPKTLQRMARNQEVPGIQIGKLWRFRMSELNAWLCRKKAS